MVWYTKESKLVYLKVPYYLLQYSVSTSYALVFHTRAYYYVGIVPNYLHIVCPRIVRASIHCPSRTQIIQLDLNVQLFLQGPSKHFGLGEQKSSAIQYPKASGMFFLSEKCCKHVLLANDRVSIVLY